MICIKEMSDNITKNILKCESDKHNFGNTQIFLNIQDSILLNKNSNFGFKNKKKMSEIIGITQSKTYNLNSTIKLELFIIKNSGS